VLLGLLLLPALLAGAQEELLIPSATPTVSEAVPPPPVPEELRSPQSTMKTFLASMKEIEEGEETTEAVDQAIQCLDLSEVPRNVREDYGKDAAVMLIEVIDRIRYVHWWDISDATQGDPYVFEETEAGDIVIARTESGAWKFSAETVESLPELFRAYEDRRKVSGAEGDIGYLSPSIWLRSKFPDRLREVGFLLEHWQWIALATLISLGLIIQRALAFFLNNLLLSRLKDRPGYSNLRERDLNIGWLLAVFIVSVAWVVALPFVGLPPQALNILFVAFQVMATLAVVFAAIKAINVFTDLWSVHADRTPSKFDNLLVPLTRSILKSIVWVAAIIFIATSFALDPTSLFAGLGLGGLAFALAARDILSNLFGSFAVILDRPFQIGDWIAVEGIEGTVEKVGFRTTRVRTFYNSLVTLPNSIITNQPIDNYGARKYRRWNTKLGLSYDTPPDRVEAFCEGVRTLVRKHKWTVKGNYQVYLNEFGESSLDVLLYVFFEVPDWGMELKSRSELMTGILHLAKELRVELAFPTRTVLVRRVEEAEDLEPLGETPEEAAQAGRELAEKFLGDSK
jgi:MscS family membrane protein